MALLPNQIIPETVPFGKVLQDGSVRISHNWYLMLYNLWLNVLGTGSALPSDALQALAGLDSDTADVDATALRLPIDNLAELIPTEADPSASPQDVAQALMWAQDGLLQERAPQAQPSAVISPGSSPWTYTAAYSGTLIVVGGTVSVISMSRQGTSIATGQTAGIFPLRRLDQLTITYSSVPAVTFLPN